MYSIYKRTYKLSLRTVHKHKAIELSYMHKYEHMYMSIAYIKAFIKAVRVRMYVRTKPRQFQIEEISDIWQIRQIPKKRRSSSARIAEPNTYRPICSCLASLSANRST